ncbi:hypothetical protein D9757_012308 [Collybiopsis confluens]|uniref:Kinase-like protein n=1 Tax=Collybiopsis confluens TaxID=2823264 RepID=A0A8H5LJ09_9AGAR|nr:hypothetical protein D9757_012308 [Collybiopsis confluens]
MAAKSAKITTQAVTQGNVAKKSDKKSDKKATKTAALQKPISSKEILANATSKKDSKKSDAKAVAPKGNGKAKPAEDSSDSSSSEDEKPKAAQVNKPSPKKKTKKAAKKDSSSESSSEEDEPSKPAAPKLASPSSSAESSSDSDDEEPAPSKPTQAKPSKDSSSESGSSSDEKDKPAPAPPQSKVASSSDSSSEESDSEEVKKWVSFFFAVCWRLRDNGICLLECLLAQSSKAAEGSSDSSDDEGKRKAVDEAPAPPKKVKLANGNAAPAADSGDEVKSIFVGQLSWNVDNDWLAQEFASCGQVESATVQMDRTSGRSRGFGYVHFTTSEAVAKAVETMNGHEIDGRAIKVDKSTPMSKDASRDKRAKTFGDQTSPPSTTLFVGNLSFSANEDSVWEFFNDYGVKNVRLPTDRDTGKPKGFGYVEFDDLDAAKKAFETLSGQELEGRSVRLDYSQPRDSSGGGGGRGGFGGGRGGGFGGGREEEIVDVEEDAELLDSHEGDDPVFRKNHVGLLRFLSSKFHILPSSLMVQDVQREGGNPVAGGGFADIWRGTCRGMPVCLKVLRIVIEQDLKVRDTIRKEFCREALVWRQLRHPNILPLLGVNIDLFSPSFCLVSPWMENKDVITHLNQNPDHSLYAVLSEVAAGLRYMHSIVPPLVHGDIKGANILVTDDRRCCLADFGLSVITTSSQAWTMTTSSSATTRGSMRWLAPEYIISETVPNHPSRDIYAFGCTILEIFTQKPPFSDRKNEASVLLYLISGGRPDRPRDVRYSDAIWDLTTLCWAQNVGERPSANQICEYLNHRIRLGHEYEHRKQYAQAKRLGELHIGSTPPPISFTENWHTSVHDPSVPSELSGLVHDVETLYCDGNSHGNPQGSLRYHRPTLRVELPVGSNRSPDHRRIHLPHDDRTSFCPFPSTPTPSCVRDPASSPLSLTYGKAFPAIQPPSPLDRPEDYSSPSVTTYAYPTTSGANSENIWDPRASEYGQHLQDSNFSLKSSMSPPPSPTYYSSPSFATYQFPAHLPPSVAKAEVAWHYRASEHPPESNFSLRSRMSPPLSPTYYPSPSFAAYTFPAHSTQSVAKSEGIWDHRVSQTPEPKENTCLEPGLSMRSRMSPPPSPTPAGASYALPRHTSPSVAKSDHRSSKALEHARKAGLESDLSVGSCMSSPLSPTYYSSPSYAWSPKPEFRGSWELPGHCGPSDPPPSASPLFVRSQDPSSLSGTHHPFRGVTSPAHPEDRLTGARKPMEDKYSEFNSSMRSRMSPPPSPTFGRATSLLFK